MGKAISQIEEIMLVNNVPAYTISNENQRWATQVIPNVKSVLTVAGSGDQALFYKLSGAKIIDTYDITCNARVIQDVKCAMIKHLDLYDYKELLVRLHRADGNEMHFLLNDLLRVLPDETLEIIENNKNSMIFGCGLDAGYYPENIPDAAEYEKLKKTLKNPFHFIWSDLESLSTKLTRKYDLINISNIFDYVANAQKQVDILNSLSKRLNKGGRIVYLPQKTRFSYKKLDLPHLVYEKTLTDNKRTKMILLQRTK